MSVLNSFDYKEKFMTPWEFEQDAFSLVDAIRTLTKVPKGRFATFEDPDKTFTLITGPQYTRVTLLEGESNGVHVLLVKESPQKCVIYTPGPWATRIRLLIDSETQ